MCLSNLNVIYLLSCLLIIITISGKRKKKKAHCDLEVDCLDHMGVDNKSSNFSLLRKVRKSKQSELTFKR